MINDVLVCVNNIEKRSSAVLAACKFALQHGAKLTAVYIKLDTVEIVRWSGTSPIDLADQVLANEDQREANAKAKFESLTKKIACKKVWSTVNQSENPIMQLVCTDIIFNEQPVGSDLSYFGDESFINHLILQTKRPVIMIPDNWQSDLLGSKALLGWNKSPEAMRAISDAIPILEKAESVEILHIVHNSLFHGEPDSSADIETYLLNKGIKTSLTVEGAGKHDDTESLLLNWAIGHDINLIVIGGYGHSRLRELVMGGMTKHLIKNSTLPVLLSH